MTVMRELLGMNPVKPHKLRKLPKGGVFVADSTLLYGIELEIEHVLDWGDWDLDGFLIENDGSLRNNGKEFISKPMTLPMLHTALDNLLVPGRFGPQCYSERTSIHVHTNIQELTPKELAGLCFLYQVFEPLFFKFVGGERDKNIFCVPWSETNLTYDMISKFTEAQDPQLFRRWMKYSALNLLPIITQGTVEFRHMPGHCDVAKIIDWCNLIGSLYQMVKKYFLEAIKERVLMLNTTSMYDQFMEDVFTRWTPLLRVDQYREAMEEGVTMMKYLLSNDGKTTATKARKLTPGVRLPGFVERDVIEDAHRMAAEEYVRVLDQVNINLPAAAPQVRALPLRRR